MKEPDRKILRILVADDEPTTMTLYRQVLCGENEETSSALSFELVTCSQGDEAVQAVKISIKENRPFAIAFLDVQMPPGPDGIWAAEQIRALDPHVEIIIVTAYSNIDPKDIARQVLPAHKLLYIQKPFHSQEIRQFASALCSKWLMERELHEYRERLEILVKERTTELSEANKLLEQEIAERRQADKALYEKEANLLAQNNILTVLMRQKTFYDGSFDNSIRKITETGAHTLKVERSSMWLFNQDQSKLLCTDLYEMTTGSHSKGMELSASDYPDYFDAVKNTRSIAANDARTDPRTKEFTEIYLFPLGITSLLDASVWLGGKVIGILRHEHMGQRRRWSAEDQNFAGSLTDLISIIMEMSVRMQTEERLKKINDCLSSLGTDYHDNINRITALCGNLFSADYALYNRLDGQILCSPGQWKTPENYKAIDKPDGQICYDVIQSGKDDIFVMRDLHNSVYAESDPNVRLHNLKTYVGRAVKCGNRNVGSLCALFRQDFEPSDEERRILGIIASAISVEEERRRAENAITTRLHYEEGLARCSQTLLNKGDLTGAIRHLLNSSGVSRIYIFENFQDPDGGLHMRQTNEVCATGVKPEIDNPDLQHLPYKDGFERWQEVLSKGGWIGGLVNAFPQMERDILEPQDILSVLVLPINVRGEWYGFIGFDDTQSKREWTKEDIRILQTGAEMIGSYLHQRQARKENESLAWELARSEKMEAIGTLAGGVAHDLNNVLAGVVSYPDLLLMRLPEDSPLRKPILTMQESGNKATAIVQDLLTLARRGVAVNEVVNLNSVIHKYLESPEYEKMKSFHPNVEVETDLKGDLLNLLGSPVHLYKTVMNLVSNAAEAMPKGGKLSISTSNRYLDRPVKGYDDIKEGDYIVLSVSDTGTGISSEDIDRIFEPFYTKKKMGKSGTGLGMAVVWGTVKDHKGYIDVQSTIGKGTSFTLYFPVTRQKQSKDRISLRMEDYMGEGETILVVDDVKEQRDIASTILAELGYTVNTVSSGEEAVEFIKNEPVDLLVLDMIMDPGMDGLDTYRQIVKFRPGQKAIIASGFSETDRVKEAERLGVGQYLKKPYTLEKIGMTVKIGLGAKTSPSKGSS